MDCKLFHNKNTWQINSIQNCIENNFMIKMHNKLFYNIKICYSMPNLFFFFFQVILWFQVTITIT